MLYVSELGDTTVPVAPLNLGERVILVRSQLVLRIGSKDDSIWRYIFSCQLSPNVSHEHGG